MNPEENLERRDYDINAIPNYDNRFEAGKKDSIFLHTLGFVCTVIATVFMYALGTGDPAEMPYFLGYPLWVSGAVLIYLAMFVVGMVYVWQWEEFSLSPKDHTKRKEKQTS